MPKLIENKFKNTVYMTDIPNYPDYLIDNWGGIVRKTTFRPISQIKRGNSNYVFLTRKKKQYQLSVNKLCRTLFPENLLNL